MDKSDENLTSLFIGAAVSACSTNNGGCGEDAVCSDNGTISCACFPGYTPSITGCVGNLYIFFIFEKITSD
jgi:hypothetical protein